MALEAGTRVIVEAESTERTAQQEDHISLGTPGALKALQGAGS